MGTDALDTSADNGPPDRCGSGRSRRRPPGSVRRARRDTRDRTVVTVDDEILRTEVAPSPAAGQALADEWRPAFESKGSENA